MPAVEDMDLNKPAQRVRALNVKISENGLGLNFGVVHQVHGQIVKAGLRSVTVGQQVQLVPHHGHSPINAEVIGVERDIATLSTHTDPKNVSAGSRVIVLEDELKIAVGPHLLGHVVDGFGNCIDELALPLPEDRKLYPLQAPAQKPLERSHITEVLPTGLRVIDGLLTLAKGQRIGLFGAPGTGKTSLVASIAQQCDADVVVLGLVGERGREIRDFIDHVLTEELRKKVIVVASTSDRPAMERLYAARTATAVAEGFRDQGKSVLLIMDSLTRVARALREIGLAAGEAPTRRGFPASVYPALPALIERAGAGEKGTITAIYTILLEGEGEGDPIAEEVRSLTDGHIVLSRKLAEAGHYPAIDVLASLSRLMRDIVTPEQAEASNRVRSLLAKYDEIELLLQVGELKRGQDKEADAACDARAVIQDFCRQSEAEKTSFAEMLKKLQGIVA